MAIPPFPSQDLAKLVLGYLAEEQLMTAYDEFLQASPYLDVFRNEYDRIFMTSLKSILAEYRAVKIYVETCKPHLLRKKLFQCSNLLEVVKFLVTYVDVNRLHAQECTTEKISLKQSYVKSNGCDVCNSLSLGACICKRNIKSLSTLQPSQIVCPLRTSTETTSLEDLPGNCVNSNKKSYKNEELNEIFLSPNALAEPDIGAGVKSSVTDSTHGSHVPLDVNQDIAQVTLNTQDVLTANLIETQEKIENLRNIINTECNKDYVLAQRPRDSFDIQKFISNAGSFQDFAIGVSGSTDSEKSIVPDSSTSENHNVQSATTRDNKTNINPITNIKGPPKPQFLHKLPTPISKDTRHQKFRPIKPKPDEQKIKILSDVKLDDVVKKNMLIMPPLQPISSPLLHMQRIVINGNNNSGNGNFRYNKEEIMAMPTIILVPSSGPQSRTIATVSSSNNINIKTTQANTPNPLLPLVIDVSSNSSNTVQDKNKENDIKTQEAKIPVEMSLVKTVDITHNSLPKDNNMAISNKTSTPNILPPARKSSSTPRRTSHVRVLDFTTPRRILHETINEQDNQTDKLVISEVIDLDNPNVSNVDNVEDSKVESEVKNISTKENNVKQKKKNWDAELRVLAVRNDESIEATPRSKSKHTRNVKKKTPMLEKTNEKSKIDKIDDMSCKKKKSPKTKKTKKTVKSVDIVKEPVVNVVQTEEPVVKPTVNIISKSDWNTLDNLSKENNENQIIMNNSDDRTETPDAERLSLQNVIGAKLNISDLLETPYKQVLYDIQMETPKFLGPDLPGEPISDIKISNIPTPRFFDTPKPVQATPSSYSSRPTDYSSGGSYYKPDDQDFVPEILNFDVTIVEEKDMICKEEKSEPKVEEKKKLERSSRPQRKCTRNVSYRSPITRTKDDDIPVTSTCTSTSSRDKRTKSTDSKNKSKSKSVMKKREVPVKSPFRKESFLLKSTPNKIKIKPFKTTPSKELSIRKKKTSISQTPSSKLKNRTSKDKIHITPATLAVPTKSRRKSSTPRKLDTNTYQDNIDNTSSDQSKSDQDIVKDCPQDSDSDRPLRWSEERSRDAKPAENVEDELKNIKEYIESTISKKDDIEGSLHGDLVKRGFDVETAKKIERDLLDSTEIQDTAVQSTSNSCNLGTSNAHNVSDKLESDCSTNNLQIVQDEEDIEEIELSVRGCDEESDNYITYQFNEAEFVPKPDTAKLKDKFSMEVCIDDDVSIRLRSTNFKVSFEESSIEYNPKETEDAVNSICNFDKLYTPMKDRRAQCYEIFDSTLTSIDTPLKSEKQVCERVTEIVLEVESIEMKEKTDTKKRKRITSEAADTSINKKSKPDAQYLLNSANIQNIDIESVLSKLHGP